MTREEAIEYAESKKMRLEALVYNDDCKYGNYAMYSGELMCKTCGWTGPFRNAEYEARLAWNTRAPILSESELKKLEETT